MPANPDGVTVGRGASIFADLPVLGSFARQNRQVDLSKNLLIFITSRIIR
ncbi:MAG: hypothetical protein O2894_10530 [Planctomycetota bacterium]|nr:hypothetical protein [Planctomycetota bacterium]